MIYSTIFAYHPKQGNGSIKKFKDFEGPNNWARFCNMIKVKYDYGHKLVETTSDKHSETHLFDDGSWLHYVAHN